MTDSKTIEDTIKKNRDLLENNIIWTTELNELLRTQKVIPDSLLDDIKECSKMFDKNRLLLDHVVRMGVRVFRRFVAILYSTGHTIIADIITDVDITKEGDNIDRRLKEELNKRLPVIEKLLSPTDIHSLIGYVKKKMIESAVQTRAVNWTDSKAMMFEDQDKLVKQELVQQRTLKNKAKEVETLEGALMKIKKDVNYKEQAIDGLQKEMTSLDQKHKEKVQTLIKASDATAKANRNMLELQGKVHEELHRIINELQAFMGKPLSDNHARASDPIDLCYLEENIKLLKDAKLETEDRLYKLRSNIQDERFEAFQAMDVQDEGQTMKDAYKAANDRVMAQRRILLANISKLYRASLAELPATQKRESIKRSSSIFESGGDGLKRAISTETGNDCGNDPKTINEKIENTLDNIEQMKVLIKEKEKTIENLNNSMAEEKKKFQELLNTQKKERVKNTWVVVTQKARNGQLPPMSKSPVPKVPFVDGAATNNDVEPSPQTPSNNTPRSKSPHKLPRPQAPPKQQEQSADSPVQSNQDTTTPKSGKRLDTRALIASLDSKVMEVMKSPRPRRDSLKISPMRQSTASNGKQFTFNNTPWRQHKK